MSQHIPGTGPTGEFPQGKLSPDDEGELKVALETDRQQNVLKMYFGKPVTWLGLGKMDAINFANALLQAAKELVD